eukprot:CAMPEP_0205812906 /NCGR_PEP_ID=MMETSP0205-20121125/17521_1 /ASSEMBLY_ACC=CAM_ASM_000278 /TAXON_ID=36767 /ORGANISM="Euplotes focardii, Strain TN1" /LENGTH=77 /DNA_ID=CAMNT_0053094375 /DNA_START=87 /DNA_END=320 /DNA_ORIENTATION=+
MRDIGKREAEKEYRKMLDEGNIQHQKEVDNLKNQYEYLLQDKEKQLEKFVNEFKEYHTQKKDEIQIARVEIIHLYSV